MNLGDVVACPMGGALMVGGRLMSQVDDRAECWWVDLNILGSHLTQMYTEHELVVIDKPSRAAEYGLCPSCLGLGIVNKCMPVVHSGACQACHGSGSLTHRLLVHADENGVRARVVESRARTRQDTA